MPIANNDLVQVDRRDSNNVGSNTAVQLIGTTANAAAVTQLTGRTTGVTINSAVGAITLFNVANSAVDATFTVTNSLVEAGDVILMSQRSGVDPQRIAVTNVAAGSFRVTCAAISGATCRSA